MYAHRSREAFIRKTPFSVATLNRPNAHSFLLSAFA
jgi:hypothetical protein